MSKSSQQITRRATIKDVARTAGVSVTTVSNVLNDRTEAMTVDTLLRVQQAIRSLNYRPSRVARSLVTSYTATIGLIINEISTPLFLQALNFIEPIARKAGHNILLCTAGNVEDEKQAVNLLLEKNVDGIIFLSNSFYLDDDFLTHLSSLALPVVLVNRTTDHDRFDKINFDNLKGVIDAIQFLVQLGHHRIAHLHGATNRRSFEERLQGYRLGLEQTHLRFREDYLRLTDYESRPDTWEQETLALLALTPRPTAIIVATDVIAATVLRVLQRADVRVPQDITVVGIDNQPFCTYLNPALTTIQLPIIEAGKRAIEMLLGRISGERMTTEHLLLPCPLIVRESSGEAAK